MKTKRLLILIFGIVSVLIYALLLYFHPQESWCDDAFWTDWARQLAIHGRYFTTVWGGGHPSYCPLYAYALAGWIRLFGFSFFKVRLFNVIILLICYYILSLFLINRTLLSSKFSILLFSSLFWFLPSLFDIYNCGRIEVLCLLLGICSIIFFIKVRESHSIGNVIGLFFSSFLLFATGVEGVVFTTIICTIYSVFLKIYCKEECHILRSFLYMSLGYIASFLSLVIITKMNDCLHEFFDTMFGFSSTLSKYYFLVRQFVKNAIHGQFVSIDFPQSQTDSSFIQTVLSRYIMNKEYLFLILILVIISALLLFRKKKMPTGAVSLCTVSVITPLIFTLAGRYVSYYTWAALIPAIIAICIILDKIKIPKIFQILAVFTVLIYSGWKYDWDTFDVKREKDLSHKEDICSVSSLLFPSKPCVIPYQWYYYVVPQSENIYFQGSGGVPKDIQYIIYSANDYNEKEFMDCFELEERTRFDDKIVYKVLSIKESWIIRY